MRSVTATELVRNFKQLFDLVEFHGEELTVMRNNHQVAKIVPGLATMNALDAMSDLYRTLPDNAATEWAKDMRENGMALSEDIRDPWAS
ncbi:MAG: type II toxin-antitoxin system Phd/YefM family antitoxin [Syntrophus sp. (in: bacteria)]|nr:type II toxin-antitoxin system Phd/YefM family antitoxin [Syntrophus sp. (in: bacteria)]